MAESQQQMDGSFVVTGDMEILGDVKNSQIESISTKTETSYAEIQTIGEKMNTMFLGYADDSVITPTEKASIRNSWEGIKAEYPNVVNRATVQGIAQASIDAYAEAYLALQAFLFSGPAILVDLAEDTAVNRAEYVAVFEAYLNTKEAINLDIDESTSAQLQTLGVNVTLSAYSVKRDRMATLSPASIGMQATYANGDNFSGRFIVELLAGGNWIQDYASSVNESYHLYTIPATVTGKFTEAVKVRLFQPGGTGDEIREKICSVDLIPSTTVMYWGALSAAPSTGFIAGDYYLDNRTPALGGGLLRYFTGSVWAEYTALLSGYPDAMSKALVDLKNWAITQGQTVAATVKLETAVTKTMAQKQIVASLPVSPFTGYTAGDMVVLTTDSKVYRFTGTAWTAAVPTADLSGTIAEAQIGAGAVSITKMASGLRPTRVVAALPANPYTGYAVGDTVVLTTDKKLYRLTSVSLPTTTGWTAAVPTSDLSGTVSEAQIASGAVSITKMASGLRPPRVVASLPVSPFTGYAAGDTVVLTSDNKLYRFTGTAFTKDVDAVDIVANSITAAQIATGAITADEIAANAVTATKVMAGSILASKLSVIAANLVNNVTLNGNINGWGNVLEDGSGTPVYATYDATEKAIKITTAAAAAVRSVGFKVDHSKIYRVSVRYKKSAAHGTTYIGLTAATSDIAGSDATGTGSGSELITPIGFTSRSLGAATANWYNVAALAGSTSYVEYVFFVVGARRSQLEFPDGANIDCAKLADTTTHLAVRFLNWGNTVSTSMYIRDISVTEVGAGIIVAENIKAGAITAAKIAAGTITASEINVANLAANAGFYNALSAVSAFIQTIASSAVMATYLTASTAFIDALTATTAFISKIFANIIVVTTGGSIEYQTGSGANKRAVRLHDESIEWVDIPDTTPATPEKISSRIGRLSSGGAVLLDGQYFASLDTPQGSETLVSSTGKFDLKIIQRANGEIRCAYVYTAYSKTVERIWLGSGWGAEITICASASRYPEYYEDANGVLRILYMLSSGAILYERYWNGSAWGTEVSLGFTGQYASYLELNTGELRLITQQISGTSVYERIWNGSAWGTQTTILSSISYPSFLISRDGNHRWCYTKVPTNYIYERIWDGSAWGAEQAITSVSAMWGRYIQFLDGTIKIIYSDASTTMLYEQTYNGTSWGSPVLVRSTMAAYPMYLQLKDGNLWLAFVSYYEGATLKTIDRYYRIGGGIIETGSNSNGSWVKYGDGSLVCRYLGTAAARIHNSVTKHTFPTVFYSIDRILAFANCDAASPASCYITNYRSYTMSDVDLQWTSQTGASMTIRLGYTAFGRWKA